MGEGKSKAAVEPLVGALAILIPLVLLCDTAAFALCFWWYDLGLPVSGAVAMSAPIGRVLRILDGTDDTPTRAGLFGQYHYVLFRRCVEMRLLPGFTPARPPL